MMPLSSPNTELDFPAVQISENLIPKISRGVLIILSQGIFCPPEHLLSYNLVPAK